ncbi:FliI/YscN family ATPase [Anaeromyxobacter paludicola]|uniref:EscN/YscN/HrcN family type III secretion system ATPase n=1 Tax=Anaeromyxobacter paludicola TaxID=2918171 RepID=A0ABN6N3K7_9BACT|nr:FliI/YscN family ATPase [Anaeromyxobacter paludicola]BDG07759.1 EscN/YscN/HrcN family type III secretion system ATPase [Anaeromyxobacter paludicola]
MRPARELAAAVAAVRTVPLRGRVAALTGLSIRARVPAVRAGELVRVEAAGRAPLAAQVVGFEGDEAVLLPLGDPRGVGPDSAVLTSGRPLEVGVGPALVGRVLDGLGAPIDAKGPLAGLCAWPVERPAPPPLSRAPVRVPLPLGVRAIDAVATVGEGQRVGLFAGAGVGKSTLLARIARDAACDLAVVCLVGERGREVRDFVEDALGAPGLARSVVVAATSDAPALVRLAAPRVATAIAEWFAEVEGRRVLLLVDSLTRFARAQREAGLAAGEPPVRQGYPPSVFAELPRLVERAGGRSGGGAVTAVYTVLVAGGDLEEPIADEVRGLLDGHVVLDRRLAERGQWPAVDPLQSLSRLMPALASPAHLAAAGRLRGHLAAYERHRDLIALGAYAAGSDPRTDEAIARIGAIERFLAQPLGETAPFSETVERLAEVVG